MPLFLRFFHSVRPAMTPARIVCNFAGGRAALTGRAHGCSDHCCKRAENRSQLGAVTRGPSDTPNSEVSATSWPRSTFEATTDQELGLWRFRVEETSRLHSYEGEWMKN